jgi:hypothetical protein
MKTLKLKNIITSICLIGFLTITLAGCYSQKIVVGNGAPARQGAEIASNEESVWTWHLLFGLIPLQGPVNAQAMAKGASNYTVVYEQTFMRIKS